MSAFEYSTRALIYKGELFLAVSTLEELALKMRRDCRQWQQQVIILDEIIANARETERIMR